MGDSFNLFILQQAYKSVSIANLALNKVLKISPETQLNEQQEEVKEEDAEQGSFFQKIKDGWKQSVEWSKKVAMAPIKKMGNWAEESQIDIENQLKQQYNYDVNQWVFSRENLEVLDRMQSILDFTLSDVENISYTKKFKYLMAFATLQKIARAFNEEVVFRDQSINSSMSTRNPNSPSLDDLEIEMKQIIDELKYYCKLAHGVYGDVMNYVYSGKEYSRLVRNTNYTQEFLQYTNISEDDLLQSFWEATPYRPGYCIAKDDKRQELLLIMRGSNNWADFVTDVIFVYANFSIYTINETDIKIKVNYCVSAECGNQYDQKSIIQDKLKSIGLLLDPTINTDSPDNISCRLLYRGFTHSGMFLSALQLYSELNQYLEKFFVQERYQNYKLSITGHSLGGGMTQLMLFFMLLKPPNFISQYTFNSMKGYTFGSPPVLSQEFTTIFKGRLINLVNQYDLVSRACFGTAKDLANVIKYMDNKKKTNKKFIDEIINVKFNKNEELDQQAIFERYQKYIDLYKEIKQECLTTRKLVLQGRVFLLKFIKKIQEEKEKINDVLYSFEEIKDYSFFNDLIFSRKLVKYHFPHLYEEGLESKLAILPSQY